MSGHYVYYDEDKALPLDVLRECLQRDPTHSNTENLVMILCDRLEAALTRITELEQHITDCESAFTRHRIKVHGDRG